MAACVDVRESGRHAVVTLNLPEKRNPISAAMRTALMQALEGLRAKSRVRAVVITGAGSAFCSGLDLAAFAEQQRLPAEMQRADSQSIADFFEYIYRYPLPTIAAVNGPATAGGAGLALLCDLTFMAESAYLCFSEVRIGFVPALVGVYLSRQAGPKVARDLLLTARRVGAAEALQLGLVQRVETNGNLLRSAEDGAEEIGQWAPEAVKKTKGLLLESADDTWPAGLKKAVEVNAATRLSDECKEGVAAFLERRPPHWLA